MLLGNIFYKSNLRKKNKQYGFSLIELSIVLIIIAVIVSGVVGGQSLIKSAKIKTIISEYRNYEISINAYLAASSKHGLPGDSTVGDNNGRIEYKNTSGVFECFEAWLDLANDGLIDFKGKQENTEAGLYNPLFFAYNKIKNFSLIANAYSAECVGEREYEVDGVCTVCPMNKYLSRDGKSCTSNCFQDGYADLTLKICVDSCPSGTYTTDYANAHQYGSFCSLTCPSSGGGYASSGRFISRDGKSCKPNCFSDGVADTTSNKCVDGCPIGTYTTDYTNAHQYGSFCSTTCPASGGNYAHNGKFLSRDGRKCTLNCFSDGYADLTSNKCVDDCPSGTYRTEYNKSWTYGSFCSVDCPSSVNPTLGIYISNDHKSCIASCPNGYSPISGICTKDGECPDGYKMEDGECVDESRGKADENLPVSKYDKSIGWGLDYDYSKNKNILFLTGTMEGSSFRDLNPLMPIKVLEAVDKK